MGFIPPAPAAPQGLLLPAPAPAAAPQGFVGADVEAGDGAEGKALANADAEGGTTAGAGVLLLLVEEVAAGDAGGAAAAAPPPLTKNRVDLGTMP